MKAKATGAAILASAMLLGGCVYEPTYRTTASYPAGYPATAYPAAPGPVARVEYGTVESIEMYRNGQASPIGLGAILGGVAGGIIGHQIGAGVGNTAATIAGAVGGAVVGNQIERANQGDRYRMIVRLDSGATLAISDIGEGEIRVGDRVRIINGRAYRA